MQQNFHVVILRVASHYLVKKGKFALENYQKSNQQTTPKNNHILQGPDALPFEAIIISNLLNQGQTAPESTTMEQREPGPDWSSVHSTSESPLPKASLSLLYLLCKEVTGAVLPPHAANTRQRSLSAFAQSLFILLYMCMNHTYNLKELNHKCLVPNYSCPAPQFTSC